MNKIKFVIIVLIVVILIAVLTMVFEKESLNPEKLQNALDECTNRVNLGMSDRDLENCLDDAYNQYGSEEQKQNWFDGEH